MLADNSKAKTFSPLKDIINYPNAEKKKEDKNNKKDIKMPEKSLEPIDEQSEIVHQILSAPVHPKNSVSLS